MVFDLTIKEDKQVDQYNFFEWITRETNTKWWVDTADPDEVQNGLLHHALGVTMNPLLLSQVLGKRPDMLWKLKDKITSKDPKTFDKAEIIMKEATCIIADLIKPVFDKTLAKSGYVCAQVDPSKASDQEYMYSSAKRFHAWRPNIAVKLPCTLAGLEAMEQCVSQGITVTSTVSFSVAQLISIAEYYRNGIIKAKKEGRIPGRCYAVIMIGRLDDYLRDVALEQKANICEGDIIQAGIASVKKAYEIYMQNRYEAELMVSGMRGTYHLTKITGGDLILSIHPHFQSAALEMKGPWSKRIDLPVSDKVLNRLRTLPEFLKAYEPDGMKPEEFTTYGAVQRTLTQFTESGWKALRSYYDRLCIPPLIY
jgi:transaldolase